MMQTLIQHITKLAQAATAVTSQNTWQALNYVQIKSDLGGMDRFEPTREGYRD
jgi:hypothetical protein